MWHPPFFEHEGEQYDLSHLQPTQVDLTINAHKDNPELDLVLDVKFSNHCYSESEPRADGAPHDFLDHNNIQRWFCPNRHASSYMLSDLLTQLPSKKCLFTGRHNWLVVELTGNDGVMIPFHVYFRLKRNAAEENGLSLFIESAYKKTRGDNSPKRRGSMDRTAFAMLARKTLAGESVRKPKGRR